MHFYFLKEPVKLDPRLDILKTFMISPIFLKVFHNTVMIYNTRNRNNDKKVRKKKSPVLMFMQEESGTCNSKQTNLKGIYS